MNYVAECNRRLFGKMVERQKPKQSKIYSEIIKLQKPKQSKVYSEIIKCQKPKQSKIYPENIINENVSNTPEMISNAFTNYFQDLYQPHEDDTFDKLTRNEIETAFTHIKRACYEDDSDPGGQVN